MNFFGSIVNLFSRFPESVDMGGLKVRGEGGFRLPLLLWDVAAEATVRST